MAGVTRCEIPTCPDSQVDRDLSRFRVVATRHVYCPGGGISEKGCLGVEAVGSWSHPQAGSVPCVPSRLKILLMLRITPASRNSWTKSSRPERNVQASSIQRKRGLQSHGVAEIVLRRLGPIFQFRGQHAQSILRVIGFFLPEGRISSQIPQISLKFGQFIKECEAVFLKQPRPPLLVPEGPEGRTWERGWPPLPPPDYNRGGWISILHMASRVAHLPARRCKAVPPSLVQPGRI